MNCKISFIEPQIIIKGCDSEQWSEQIPLLHAASTIVVQLAVSYKQYLSPLSGGIAVTSCDRYLSKTHHLLHPGPQFLVLKLTSTRVYDRNLQHTGSISSTLHLWHKKS